MKTQKYVKIIIWYLDNFVSFLLDFRKKVCFQSNLSFSNMHSKLFSNLHSEIPIMLKMETIGPIFFSESNKKHKKTIFREKKFFFRFLDPKFFWSEKIFDPKKSWKSKFSISEKKMFWVSETLPSDLVAPNTLLEDSLDRFWWRWPEVRAKIHFPAWNFWSYTYTSIRLALYLTPAVWLIENPAFGRGQPCVQKSISKTHN